MTVLHAYTIALSFTALPCTVCTVAWAFIRDLPTISCAGHAFAAIIVAGLAVVSISSTKLNDPALTQVTNVLLCVFIGANPLVQFETLNKVLRLLDLLPQYALICIVFARVITGLEIVAVIILVALPHLSSVLLSAFLLGVTVKCIFLAVILFGLHKGRAQQLCSLSISLASFIPSVLGFCHKGTEILIWSLWTLLLLISLSQSFLLLLHEIKKCFGCMNDRAARRHYTHQGNRSLTEILALDDGASTLISTQHSAYQGEQFCCNGDPGTLENPVWWKIPMNNLQSHSPSDGLQIVCYGQDSGSAGGHSAQLIPQGETGKGIRVTTDIHVNYEDETTCGPGFFTKKDGGYRWAFPWVRVSQASHQVDDETWETETIACHWRRWSPGAKLD